MNISIHIRANDSVEGVNVFEVLDVCIACVWGVCQPFSRVTFTESGGGLRCVSGLSMQVSKQPITRARQRSFHAIEPNHSPHFIVGGTTE